MCRRHLLDSRTSEPFLSSAAWEKFFLVLTAIPWGGPPLGLSFFNLTFGVNQFVFGGKKWNLFEKLVTLVTEMAFWLHAIKQSESLSMDIFWKIEIVIWKMMSKYVLKTSFTVSLILCHVNIVHQDYWSSYVWRLSMSNRIFCYWREYKLKKMEKIDMKVTPFQMLICSSQRNWSTIQGNFLVSESQPHISFFWGNISYWFDPQTNLILIFSPRWWFCLISYLYGIWIFF